MKKVLLYQEHIYANLVNVRATLDLNDIPYEIQDENLALVGYGAAIGGVKLFVWENHFEEAVKTLLKADIITDQQANDALGDGGYLY